jgi:hypothetical protein
VGGCWRVKYGRSLIAALNKEPKILSPPRGSDEVAD